MDAAALSFSKLRLELIMHGMLRVGGPFDADAIRAEFRRFLGA